MPHFTVYVCKTLASPRGNPDVFYGQSKIEAATYVDAEKIARNKLTHNHDDVSWEGATYDYLASGIHRYVEGSFQVLAIDAVPVSIKQMLEEHHETDHPIDFSDN
jgi:hypothetical protein